MKIKSIQKRLLNIAAKKKNDQELMPNLIYSIGIIAHLRNLLALNSAMKIDTFKPVLEDAIKLIKQCEAA